MSDNNSNSERRSTDNAIVANTQLREDEGIQLMLKGLGITEVQVVQNKSLYEVMFIIQGNAERSNEIHQSLLNVNPIDIVNEVRTILRKLTSRPIDFEATKHCSEDLTDEAIGSRELPGKTDQELLWKVVHQYEGNDELIHARFDFRDLVRNPSNIKDGFHEILLAEEEIDIQTTHGKTIISYWWNSYLDGVHELHLVYPRKPNDRDLSKNEEMIAYEVVEAELHRMLIEANLHEIVLITDLSDDRNGERLTGTSADQRYDTPFHESGPKITTTLNGMLIEGHITSAFIEGLRTTIAEQEKKGNTKGLTITICNPDKEEGLKSDMMQPTIDWEIHCYAKVETKVRNARDVVEYLLREEIVCDPDFRNITQTVEYIENASSFINMKEIIIEWSIQEWEALNNEACEAFIHALREQYNATQGVGQIFLTAIATPVINDDDIVVVTIRIGSDFQE